MIRFRRPLANLVLLPFAAAAAAGLLAWSDPLWRFDVLAFDALARLTPAVPPRDVVIVAIDERSLAALGRWPWSRAVHARMLRRMAASSPRAVVFDIAFNEPSADDGELADAIRENGRVVLPVVPERTREGGAPVETLPTTPLAEAAAALGHVDVEIDPDGLVRTAYLRAGMGGARWPMLALAALEVGGETPTVAGERDPETAPAPHLWLRDHRVLVPFVGPPGTFRRVSFVDVVEGTVDLASFREAYVLVGPTAPGVGDALPTAVSGGASEMPGVEFCANVLHAVRGGTTARYGTTTPAIAFTVLVVLAGGLVIVATGGRWPVAVAAVVAAAVASAAVLAVSRVWIGPAPAVAGLGLAQSATVWLRHRRESAAVSVALHRSAAALGTMGDAVVGVGAEGRVEYVNAVAERWLGRRAVDVVGSEVDTIVRVSSPEGGGPMELPSGGDRPTPARDALLDVGTGSPRRVRVSSATLRDVRGRPEGTVVVLTDRTPQPVEPGPGRAGVDPLTDLPNRAEIEERLASLLARATDDQRLGVVVLDLDRFRLINRGLGARAGDLVLREIAGRLRRTVGVADHVARVAGDEFVVLLADLPTPESGCALSRRILDELRAPTMVGDMEVSVDACIGLSLFPRDGRDAESLLRCADLAVRWAKEFSHDPIQSFDEKMRRATADRLKLEQHLRGALDRDEIDLVYQPQVGIGDGVLMGVEVLVRWNRGPLGVVPPTTFVPIAEETGLIVKIGRWALERACLQAVAWDLADLPPLRLSVNVSPRQFLDPEFAQIVGEALRRSGLAAGRLALEVTESAIMKNAEQAVAIMRTLKALGVEIALDDFGVGYSSLSYLKHFPIDRVKIDRSFVQDLATDQDDRTICSGIVAMAHSRGRLVTAEGVETPAQLAFLRAQGCDEVQGYLVSRPIDPDALATLARSAGGWIDA